MKKKVTATIEVQIGRDDWENEWSAAKETTTITYEGLDLPTDAEAVTEAINQTVVLMRRHFR